MSILDNAFHNDPIFIRDFDVTLIKEKETNYDQLFKKKLVKEHLKDDHEKKRIIEENGLEISVGHQYIIKDAENNEFDYDFTIFNSLNLSSMNGIFDVDKILVKIEHNKSFVDTLNKIRKLGYESSKEKGLIYDPYNGYVSWKNNTPQIINWQQIRLAPIKAAFRIVRTYGKANKDIEVGLTKKIELSLSNYDNCEKYMTAFYGGLFRVLGDSNGLHYLRYLDYSGIFKWATRCYKDEINFSEIFNDDLVYTQADFFQRQPVSRYQLMLERYTLFLTSIRNSSMKEKFHEEVLKNTNKIFQNEHDRIKAFVQHALTQITKNHQY